MKLAIHHSNEGFSNSWVEYCKKHGIDYKIVSCYDSDIVKQLSDCDALMWHFHQANCKDVLFAKQLMFSLQAAGKVVFPDFHTGWHFDDKVGQMYLLKAAGAPIVPTYIFYDKTKALDWVNEAEFPKVFKLRKGAGSSRVWLVNNRKEAIKIVKKAFGSGFSQYEPRSNLKERWRKFRAGKSNLWNVFKGIVRFGYTTDFDRVVGNEKGYVFFQDFVPDNEFDIRIIIIANKAFAIKRLVRDDDFRASGSGYVEYDKENFNEELVKTSFDLAERLKSKSMVLDYVFNEEQALIVEISYGYIKEVYEKCEGYWDRNLNWYPGPFDPQGWMVESVLQQIRNKSRNAPIALEQPILNYHQVLDNIENKYQPVKNRLQDFGYYKQILADYERTISRSKPTELIPTFVNHSINLDYELVCLAHKISRTQFEEWFADLYSHLASG